MILGVDPGSANCGWAVVDASARIVEIGVILSAPIADVDEAVSNERREAAQVETLLSAIRRNGVTAIAAEAQSFGGAPKARFAMAVSLCSSWGGLIGIAVALDLALYSIPPKRWQRSVQHDAGKAVDYERIERDMTAYVSGAARDQLRAIAKSKRNHALDGAAIGMLAALRPNEVDVIRPRSKR